MVKASNDTWSLISAKTPPAAGYIKLPHNFARSIKPARRLQGESYRYELSWDGRAVTGRFISTSSCPNEVVGPDVYWTAIEARREVDKFFERVRTHKVVTAAYVVSEMKDSVDRKTAGLPVAGLESSNRLKSLREQLSGVNTVWAYRSFGPSVTFMHQEDWRFQSANALHHGYPKVWIIVPAREADSLEAHFGELLNLKYTCGQFIRHRNLFVSPLQLEQWNISFSVEVQNPGEMIVTDYGVYHQVYNGGPNFAEAVNGCDSNWIPPYSYKSCVQNCLINKSDAPITRDMLQVYTPADAAASSEVSSDDIFLLDSMNQTSSESSFASGQTSQANGTQTLRSEKSFTSDTKSTTDGSVSPIQQSESDKPKSRLSDATDREKSTEAQGEVNTTLSSNRLKNMVTEALELREYILPNEDPQKQREILDRYLINDTTSASWLHEDTVNLTLSLLCNPNEDFTFWPSTIFTSDQLGWVQEFPPRARYVLCARCYEGHWELVRLHIAEKKAMLYGPECQAFTAWVRKIAKVLNEEGLWNAEYRHPTIKQLNTIDCALIVFAEAEMMINSAVRQMVQPATLSLRERYLDVILRWARIQAETVDLTGCAAQYPSNNDDGASWEISYLPLRCTMDDVFESFAAPQVFADICSLRRNQSRCRDHTQSLLSQALQLLTVSRAHIIQAQWHVRLSNALIYQKYLALVMEAHGEIRMERNRRRRAARSGQPEVSARRPRAKDRAYDKMLTMWTGPTPALREQYRHALQEIIKNAERVSMFFNSMGDGTQSPFWILCPHDNFERLADVIHEDGNQFHSYLQHCRPKLLHYYQAMCDGLRVVLGTESGVLRIDHLEPSLLADQQRDSDVLLTSLIRI